MSDWTAESVSELLIRHLPWSDSRYSEGSGFYDLSLDPSDAQRIAEELNKRAERTCEIVYKGDLWWECQSCGEQMRTIKNNPNYCPNCGCKVVGE